MRPTPTHHDAHDAPDVEGVDAGVLRRASTSSTSSLSSDASLTTAESTPASFQTASIGHGIALDTPILSSNTANPYESYPYASREELAPEPEDAEILSTPRPGYSNLTPTPRNAAQLPSQPSIPDNQRLYPGDADAAAFAAYAATTGRPLTRSITLEEAERATRTLEQEKDAFASTEGSAFSSSGHSSHAPHASVSSSQAPHTPYPPQSQSQKARAPVQSLFAESSSSAPHNSEPIHGQNGGPSSGPGYTAAHPYTHPHYDESQATIGPTFMDDYGSRTGLAGTPISMGLSNGSAYGSTAALAHTSNYPAYGLGATYGNSTRTFAATEEEKALAEEEKDVMIDRADVEDPGPGPGFDSALLNLPPPPPFDLRVESLTVGVPVIRFERLMK